MASFKLKYDVQACVPLVVFVRFRELDDMGSQFRNQKLIAIHIPDLDLEKFQDFTCMFVVV